MSVPMFVMTRFGIGIQDPAAFERKRLLFGAVTVASLAAQRRQDFHWYVFVDDDLPSEVRRPLEQLLDPYPRFHVVGLDVGAARPMTMGSIDWLWHAAREQVDVAGLVEDVGDHCITAIIDDDDAWHVDLVGEVHDHLGTGYVDALPSADRIDGAFAGLLVSHSHGRTLTFPDGLVWDAEGHRAAPLHYPWHSMNCFVSSRYASGVAATTVRHDSWRYHHHVTGFDSVEGGLAPAWIYTRYGDALTVDVQPDDYAAGDGSSQATLSQRLAEDFGIDVRGVEEYRRRYPPTPRRTGPGNLLAPQRQLDRQFLLAAWARRIDALEAALPTAGDDVPRLSALLAAAEERHADLRDAFRAGGGG